MKGVIVVLDKPLCDGGAADDMFRNDTACHIGSHQFVGFFVAISDNVDQNILRTEPKTSHLVHGAAIFDGGGYLRISQPGLKRCQYVSASCSNTARPHADTNDGLSHGSLP